MRTLTMAFVFMMASSISSTAAAQWWPSGPGYEVGYEVGYRAANRLWTHRFDLDCEQADLFLEHIETLLEEMPPFMNRHYMHGFEDGMRAVLAEVHEDCLGDDGLCELGGRTTGEIAGRLICGTELAMAKSRRLTACGLIGYSACWERLDQWVTSHCPDMDETPTFDDYARMCDQFVAEEVPVEL